MTLWTRWKRGWRRLETAPLVTLSKRRVRQVLGRAPWHFVQVRRRTVEIGGWHVSPADLAAVTTAYCFGVGEDITLDLALVERFGLEVHAFDPTPRALEWVDAQSLPANFHFHPLGVADYDGVAEFHPSNDPADPSFSFVQCGGAAGMVVAEVRRLPSIVRMLGHDRLGLLKIDIEGAEFGVLKDMLDSRIQVHQLLVEFHHRFVEVGQAATERCVQDLNAAGYRIFHISPSGREYSFIREGVDLPAG
jgi:FkbM family methyltransferase